LTVKELNILFGKNVRYYRKLKKLTQEKLASKMGVATSTIAGYEQGNRLIHPINTILLSSILDIEVWMLFCPHEIEEKRSGSKKKTVRRRSTPVSRHFGIVRIDPNKGWLPPKSERPSTAKIYNIY